MFGRKVILFQKVCIEVFFWDFSKEIACLLNVLFYYRVFVIGIEIIKFKILVLVVQIKIEGILFLYKF